VTLRGTLSQTPLLSGRAEIPATIRQMENEATELIANSAPLGEIAVVEEDLLVEEISIDGMCGVY